MNSNPQKKKTTFKGRKTGMHPLAVVAIATGVVLLGVFGYFGYQLLWGNAEPIIQPQVLDEATQEEIEQANPVAPAVKDATRKEGIYTFLVVGMDNPNNSRNTDVMMLCSFDTKAGAINVLQIPRDIYTQDVLFAGEGKLSGGGNRICKLNNVFNLAYADRQASHPEESHEQLYDYAMMYLRQKISSMFAVPIDHHVAFNTVMYRELLKVVCPITVTVPFDMDYDDDSQDLHIHLKAGRQALYPEDVEGFSRFRQNNEGQSLLEGDFSRVDLQKQVLAAIAEKVLTSITAPQAHAFVGKIINNIETSLSLENCVWLMEQALTLYANGTMTLSDIRMYDLPCKVPSWSETQSMGYTQAYGFAETTCGYTVEILNAAFQVTDVEITKEMLGYSEPFPIYYCDHSDTTGKSLQEILDKPPTVALS